MKFSTSIAVFAGVVTANDTLNIIDGINALGEGLQEIADKFYENPEAFLTEIE